MTTPLRVLIVEDNADDAELMALRLREEGFLFDWQRVESEAAYLSALETSPELILADWSLPQFSGLRALHLLRERGYDIPFIIVSGSIGEEAAVDALRQGAYDYVLKERLGRLGQAVRRALEEKSLRNEHRRHQRELEAEAMLAQALGESLELRPLLERLLAAARHAIPAAEKGSILLVEPDGCLRIRALDGYRDPRLVDFAFASSAGYSARAARERRPLLLADVRADPDIRYDGEIEEAREIHSAVVAPLLIQDRLVGVISLDATRKAAFSEQDLNTLVAFAATAALIVDNARLFQETRQRLQEMELVAAISAAVRAASSRQEILSATLDQLIAHLEIDGALIETLDPLSGELLTEQGRGVWASLTNVVIPPRKGLAAEVLATGRPYLSNELGNEPRLFSRQAARECRAAAGVPLRVQDRIIGLLWIGSQRLLGEDDLRLLNAVSDIVANSVHRATLQEQVRVQARQMTQIFATVPMGLLLLDAGGKILQANPAAEKELALMGMAVGSVLTRLGDRSLAGLLAPPTSKGLWHEIKVDGRIFEAIARPVESGSEPQQWVLAFEDVTEERQIQAQLQQQAQLAVVGQLAAGIAHDFNNIMSVILLYTKMAMTRDDLPADLHEPLETIAQQVRQATGLIQQILDFSRQSVLERRPLDLLPFLKEMGKLLERTLPENIRLHGQYGEGEFTVDADPTRIQQAIMNLAINARDAMLPQGGGELGIALSRVVATGEIRCATCGEAFSGEWVRIAVTDNGSGIPPEVLPRIFEPFFTTKEAGKGTGLGLSQVYGIVTQHGGHIDVATEVGRGTTFAVYLPAVQARPVAAPPAEELPGQGHGEVVLVVEDHAPLRKALVGILKTLNYRPLEAADGIEALAVLAEHGEVALVLSDLVMPEMGGEELLEAMRQRGVEVPLVVLSGHPLEGRLDELRGRGISGWLLKPPGVEQLSQLLARVLKEARQGQT